MTSIASAVETLSRFQFGFTASYHIMFPATSIGLSVFLVIVHALYLRTHDPLYFRLYKFWVAVFALTFTVGVVTGIFMSFQFGLNWAGYAYAVGPILGTIIGLEVLTAFFLEAGFLGVMMLGWDRVSERVHFFATCMVCLGTLISTTWILGANSWMHTPTGFTEHDGQFYLTDFWAAVLNPSFVYRYPHMILAALITGSLLVAGVSAHYLLRGRHLPFARKGLNISLGVLTLAICTQVWLGDKLAAAMGEFEPAKVAAFEGHWDDTPAAAWYVAIVPDQDEQRNEFAVGIPYLGSWLITKSFTGTMPGIKRTAPAEQPPVGWTFYAFRVMFLTAITIFALAAASVYLRVFGGLYTRRWFLRLCVCMAPAGALATVGGWLTSEIGRQPYVVYGELRTADAISPLVTSELVVSVAAFVAIYLAILVTYLHFLLKLVRRGPDHPAQVANHSGTVNANIDDGHAAHAPAAASPA